MDSVRINIVEQPGIDRPISDYYPNRSPLMSSSLIRLPLGSVRPRGWLLEVLRRQLGGLTGRLPEISPWLEKTGNAWLSTDGGGSYGWEEVPYWLRGYISLAHTLQDETAIATSHEWVEAMLASVRSDGDFGPRAEPDRPQDQWAKIVALYALRSYYAVTADQRVLSLMHGYFQFLNRSRPKNILPRLWEHMRGGELLDSILWLYNRIGDENLLRVAERVHADTARWDDSSAPASYHNVNIAQGFREPALYYLLSGNTSYLSTARWVFDEVRRKFGQVPGGMFGGDEDCRPGYDDPRQAIETCGIVEQMYADQRMLEITGNPFWGDHCENVTFNSLPAAFMPDMRALRYLTAPNMPVSDRHNHAPGVKNEGPFMLMNPLSNRCCQHNHSFGFPYLTEGLFMATGDGGLAATIYAPGSVTARVGSGTQVTISSETHYPFAERITYRITTTSGPVGFPLYLRIPGWCATPTVTVDGRQRGRGEHEHGYFRIDQHWRSGDTITLSLPMEVDVHRWTGNKNALSVSRGPLTYSLRIPHEVVPVESRTHVTFDSKVKHIVDGHAWPSFELLPTQPWNYGLELGALGAERARNTIAVEHGNWPQDDFPFAPHASPVRLRAKGRRIPTWSTDDTGLCAPLPPSPVRSSEPEEELELIPMGAARLRISVFPEVKAVTTNRRSPCQNSSHGVPGLR